MICVPVAEKSLEESAVRLQACGALADLAEIRLDALDAPPSSAQLRSFVQASPMPLIFTCRRREEGGSFQGEDEERVEWLSAAVKAGAEFVDIELLTLANLRNGLIAEAHEAKCKVIISWHNFSATPLQDELSSVLEAQKDAGADIAKIVTMARDRSDIPRLFRLYYQAESLGMPLVSFCMGDIGRLSRIACLAMGAFMSFASLESGLETAPGQIPLKKFREIVG